MKTIGIETLYEYRFLSGVRLSPDTERTAFLVHRCKPEGDSYASDLWVQGASGAHRLTASEDTGCFCWKDAEALLFASKRGKVPYGSTAFYTISTGGGEAERAFTIPMRVSRIEPLGDGRWILCALWDNAAPDTSGLSDEEREKVLRKQDENPDCNVFDELPFWFNGEGITNKKRPRLYLYDEASASLDALTPPLYQTEGWALSEDKTRVLAWGLEFSDINTGRQDVREYCVGAGKTPKERILLEAGAYSVQQAGFWGDGWLLLASDCQRYGINENPVLYTLDTSGALTLLYGEDLSYGSSVGSDCRYGGGRDFIIADGAVWFTVTDRICSRLCRVLPGGAFAYLTAAGGSVDCFDVRDGRIVFIGMRGMGLQELYALDAAGNETALTSLNAAIPQEYTISEPQPFPFTARDGLDLDGWILPPTCPAMDGQKAPAILDIHGGPKTVYGPGFFHEMQVWAAKGYYVLFCNPRGGDGRGNAFADIRGHYGDGDYQDLIEFVDRVIEAYPQIDTARIGVTGGSYGGFMTNWIIGHTTRFAAAASQRSIANWATMQTVSDIGFEFPSDQTAASIWGNPSLLWEQSPLRYASSVRTPTLFIHSREDYRCPENEGLQMFAALKRFGVPARLCLFHGENHELSRSGMPRRRVRRLEEITGWFETYLK